MTRLAELADTLDESRMSVVSTGDLGKEEKVAVGMMKKGYRFIIRAPNKKALYAKSMRHAVSVAGEFGKGATVSVLEGFDESIIDSVSQSIAQIDDLIESGISGV